VTDAAVNPEEPNADLLQMSFDALVEERKRILSNTISVKDLSQADLRRYAEICSRLRLTARPAGKPAGSGTRRPGTKKPKTVALSTEEL
jgi:hypothetical protein